MPFRIICRVTTPSTTATADRREVSSAPQRPRRTVRAGLSGAAAARRRRLARMARRDGSGAVTKWRPCPRSAADTDETGVSPSARGPCGDSEPRPHSVRRDWPAEQGSLSMLRSLSFPFGFFSYLFVFIVSHFVILFSFTLASSRSLARYFQQLS